MILTSHVLEIGTDIKMAIMITVEYILAQGRICTIGITCLSENDKYMSYLVLVFPKLLMILLAFP